MTPAELDLVLSRLEKNRKGIVLFHNSQGITAQMLPEFLRELKKRGYSLVHMVPGDAPTPIVAAGSDWISTTEPIAKTLGPKARQAPQAHEHEHEHEHEHGAPEKTKSGEP